MLKFKFTYSDIAFRQRTSITTLKYNYGREEKKWFFKTAQAWSYGKDEAQRILTHALGKRGNDRNSGKSLSKKRCTYPRKIVL